LARHDYATGAVARRGLRTLTDHTQTSQTSLTSLKIFANVPEKYKLSFYGY